MCSAKTAKDFDTATLFSMKLIKPVSVTMDPTSRQLFFICNIDYDMISLFIINTENDTACKASTTRS